MVEPRRPATLRRSVGLCLGVVATAAGLAAAGAGADAHEAARILAAGGVRGGLVVHLGCGDGRLTAALRGSGSTVVQGLDADAAKVAEAREHIQSLGLYGPVSVDTLDGKQLPYIDNVVNLVVASGKRQVASEEIARVLAPRGVVLSQAGPLDTPQLTLDARSPAGLEGWARLIKPVPPEIDDWTHWLHGPDGNAVSRDRRVGISRSLQWIMGPLWSRHHNLLPSVSAVVSANGRLFTIIDEGPISTKGVPDRWSLHAQDAFNGLLLWKRPIGNWGWRTWSEVEFAGHMRFKGPLQLERRLVAVGDVVYVTLGFDAPVVALDAATGRTIRQYKGTARTSEILHHKGRLVLARNVAGEKPGKDVLAVDAGTGALLWERKGLQGISAHNDELSRYTDAYLTAGVDKVFLLDDHVVALELKSGAEAWRKPRPPAKKGVIGHYKFYHANLCTLVHHGGRLFLGQMSPFPENLNRRQ